MRKAAKFAVVLFLGTLWNVPAVAMCAVTNTFVAGTNIQAAQVNKNFSDVSGCSGVSSLAGTASQISTSASSGAVTLSLPNAISFPGIATVLNNDLKILGSSTGATTLSSANASATNYVATLPAATDTVVELSQTQTLTNKTISGASNTITNVNLATGVTGNLAVTHLNSGTGASSTSYWRGDGTWATPSGAGTVTSVQAGSDLTAAGVPQGAITGSGSLQLYSQPGGFINKFRNGTLDIWQRGTSMTVTTAGAYTADGMFVLPTGASVAVSQVAGFDYTVHSLKVTGATSVTDAQIKQPIESYLSAAFTGLPITIQFKWKNGTGSSITPTLTVKIPTAQDNYTSTTTLVSAASLQACAAAATCTAAYTFTGSALSNLGTEIVIDFGNNFGSASNSVTLGDMDIRVTPGVATGQNSHPPTPELRPIWGELALSQRYYVSQPINMYVWATRANGNDTARAGTIWFPTIMRANPSATIAYSASSAFTYSLATTSQTIVIDGAVASSSDVAQVTNYTAAAEIAP